MKKLIIIICVVLIAGGATVFFGMTKSGVVNNSDKATDYSYTETYSSASGGYSFQYPKGFEVTDVPGDATNPEAIIVKNTEKHISLQILISQFDGGEIDLTDDIIKASIPDLKVNGSEVVQIGGSNNKGLEFMSDNSAFGGKSSEVWFINHAKLYQISTYAEFGGFLKGLVGTWKFMQ